MKIAICDFISDRVCSLSHLLQRNSKLPFHSQKMKTDKTRKRTAIDRIKFGGIFVCSLIPSTTMSRIFDLFVADRSKTQAEKNEQKIFNFTSNPVILFAHRNDEYFQRLLFFRGSKMLSSITGGKIGEEKATRHNEYSKIKICVNVKTKLEIRDFFSHLFFCFRFGFCFAVIFMHFAEFRCVRQQKTNEIFSFLISRVLVLASHQHEN